MEDKNYNTIFPIRYIARIVIESLTPLAIGCDDLKFDQDNPVIRDFNNLPYIPGTAITGFLRKKVPDEKKWGGENNDVYLGSKVIVSDALLLDSQMRVHQHVEGLSENGFYRYFEVLPVRQHVAISHLGSAKEGALFDQEIVFKGARYKFELSYECESKDDLFWESLLNSIKLEGLCLGGGEFNGFGQLKVCSVDSKLYDLNSPEDLVAYGDLDVDLNKSIEATEQIEYSPSESEELVLKGGFGCFHFGTGYGDDEVDSVNYSELCIEWENNTPKFVRKFVIPGTSIKGVLAHRLAYYYNKKNEISIEKIISENQKNIYSTSRTATDMLTKHTGSNCPEVLKVFGSAKLEDSQGGCGSVIIPDIYLNSSRQTGFRHNKIDRYTGGTIPTALFDEKVLILNELTIKIIKTSNEEGFYDLFDQAVDDLLNNKLPLGGLVNRGHGMFNPIKVN